jgi:HEAT repeat protein
VREYCIGALGKIGSADGLNTVLAAFEDSLGQVRKAAAFASGELKNSDAIPPLVKTLGDDFYGARFAALEALMALDTTEVINELTASLSASKGLQTNLICKALARIGNDAAINELYIALNSDNPEHRNYAAFAIVEADPNNQCGYLNEIKSKVNDRLALLRIESAHKAAANGSQEPK